LIVNVVLIVYMPLTNIYTIYGVQWNVPRLLRVHIARPDLLLSAVPKNPSRLP